MDIPNSLYKGLGYEQNPLLGYLTTTGGSALLGALLYKLMDKDKLRGAALGVGAGTVASLPLLAKSIEKHTKRDMPMWPAPLRNNPEGNTQVKLSGFPHYDPNTDRFNRPELSNSFLDSAIVPGAVEAVINDHNTLPDKFRQHIGRALYGSGVEASNNNRNAVTVGDVAKAGVNAGLGAATSFVLGTMLGSSSPATWAAVGGALTGSMSLGKSFGMMR